MRRTTYSRWEQGDWDSLNLEELMKELSQHLLESGFFDQFRRKVRSRGKIFDGEAPDDEIDQLRDAIREALKTSGLLDDEQYNNLFDENGNARSEALEDLIDELIARLIREGYLALQTEGEVDGWFSGDTKSIKDYLKSRRSDGHKERYKDVKVQLAVTQKGSDFLGFNALRELLGGLGWAHSGGHPTVHAAPGVEISAASKEYEFGDTLNLDTTRSILSALTRQGGALPIKFSANDLWVHQSDFESTCATVLMLDCSHSMILYGEDRFTPAKQVSLALSHLIRTQYPGDSLRVVLFHDAAEEVPLSKLAQVKVGPYHTNTAEGLRLARRILSSQSSQMKQIIMVTDGKPSALFVGDTFEVEDTTPFSSYGRYLYKNSAGLDSMIVEATLAEAAQCRRAGIMLNTFMLTDDYFLVEFVRQLTNVAQGKAYFTTPVNLGQFLLVDFLAKRSRTIR